MRLSGGTAPLFLTSALDGGEQSASRPDRFTHGKRTPSTHCSRRWVGSSAGLDAMEKRKMLFLPRIGQISLRGVIRTNM
jgi:hypothetical protein